MNRIIVLAKAPEPGRVKTRLSPPLAPSEAAMAARAALEDTLDAVRASAARRRILALDGPPGPWIQPGFEVMPQRGGGLGERLAWAFERGGCPALLIGMDTPQVTAAVVDHALGVLGRPGVDAVLGPAVDGGWWALGLRWPDSRVFQGVPMSTSEAGAAQHQRLVSLGYRTSLLPSLRDVDRFDDALAVAAAAPATRFAQGIRRLRARMWA